MGSLLTILLLFLSATIPARATTWDEPWHEDVLKNADSFVKVKVFENQGARARVDVIKLIAGTQTPHQIELTGFSMLRLTSTSSGDHGPEVEPRRVVTVVPGPKSGQGIPASHVFLTLIQFAD